MLITEDFLSQQEGIDMLFINYLKSWEICNMCILVIIVITYIAQFWWSNKRFKIYCVCRETLDGIMVKLDQMLENLYKF